MAYTIACVGARKNDLTLECVQALESAENVILHTNRCGCAEWLNENGIAYTSLDDLYESAEDFDAHADMAAKRVLDSGDGTVYCVLDFADESVKRIIASGARVRAIGAGIHSDLLARAGKGVLSVSASNICETQLSSDADTLVTELDSRELAGDVKLRLMECYPEDMPVYFLTPSGGVAEIKLSSLDRLKEYNHLCACLAPAVPELTALERFDFNRLMQLTRRLRDPENGCKWDAEQTHESMSKCLVEEAYEVKDAADRGDIDDLCEELGDILFVIALQMQIALEYAEFSPTDAITGAVQKMIRRHPHVFGDALKGSTAEMSDKWAQSKRSEKGFSTVYDEMCAVAKGLPALMRAQKVVKRSGLKIDGNTAPCIGSISNEEGLGEALMECVKWAQSRDINAETALEKAVERFLDSYKQQ